MLRVLRPGLCVVGISQTFPELEQVSGRDRKASICLLISAESGGPDGWHRQRSTMGLLFKR